MCPCSGFITSRGENIGPTALFCILIPYRREYVAIPRIFLMWSHIYLHRLPSRHTLTAPIQRLSYHTFHIHVESKMVTISTCHIYSDTSPINQIRDMIKEKRQQRRYWQQTRQQHYKTNYNRLDKTIKQYTLQMRQNNWTKYCNNMEHS